MVCVILIMNGGTYSLKSTPNNIFFEKLLMAEFLAVFAQFPAASKSPKKSILYFNLMSGGLINTSSTYTNNNKHKRKRDRQVSERNKHYINTNVVAKEFS